MWQAPEVIADPDQCSKQGDVYSFGIVLWELMMMTSPWLGIALPLISQIVQVHFPCLLAWWEHVRSATPPQNGNLSNRMFDILSL